MFETHDFNDQLEKTVSSQAEESGMREYQRRIVTYLQDLANENEDTLMETEFRKSASSRRGIPDALKSARELIKEAATYALRDNRTVVTVADVEMAYAAKFCQVWPFCK